MSKTMILLAGVALVGGLKGQPHTTPAGEVVDEAEARKLGVTVKDIPALLLSGALIEAPERTARAGDDDVVDGVTRDEFAAFLSRHGIEHDPDADVEELLNISAAEKAPTVSRDEFSDFLARHRIAHDANADLDKLLAIDPAPAFDLDGAAKRVESSMGVDAIKAELTKLEVPFETDANKPALAKLLAQVRATQPSGA